MGFIPSELVEAKSSGDISFLLERNRVLRQYARGELTRNEICDAHPELLRAAHHYSECTTDLCPICDKQSICIVSYVFGSSELRINVLSSLPAPMLEAKELIKIYRSHIFLAHLI